ncbi:MAG: lactate dehydrogenase [Hamadaea sp.]|uniref:NAD(P)-dependent oxidoreductase n=1 Tax=Hamadaea sp. TaxID=2024425 RepID=UPI001833397D|nr:NAD(P)-dependent oxidoreductase [Hamadaea sp.]NUT18031.1 lactate dehydrogenase [Hamadaea sp.]
MIYREPAHAAVRRTRSPAVPTVGITIYGCDRDEAAVFRELAPRFGVTPTLVEAALAEDSVGTAAGRRCVSVGHKTPVGHATLRALRLAGVAYISTRSIGQDHIDVAYAESLGLTVEGIAYSPDSVADYTVMVTLMVLRQAKAMIRRVGLHDYRLGDVRGRELRDLTVGVVGTGRIGGAVIDRLAGFGSRVLTHDRNPRAGADHVSLDDLVRQSDIVTLHTPLTAETRHLLDRRRIGLMRPGAILVNTGRGGLVDTEALLAALEDGMLGGAALDVLEGEEGVFYADFRHRPVPNRALLRLQQLPNVLVSPHTAYFTDHALRDAVENSLMNCVNFESRYHRG